MNRGAVPRVLLTAVMEEIDEERFRRGPRPLGMGLGSQKQPVAEGEAPRSSLASGPDREEVLLGSTGGRPRVQVRGRTPAGRSAIREELQLLAALEVAGVGAAPAVLEIQDDGYTRESAPQLQRRTGRRAADDGVPPTAERLALTRARDDLDELIDDLHRRGWVLGAPTAHGLGVRSDGSIVVLELGGLRRHEGFAERQADRRWVDSVLQDQERTLRRRVNRTGSSWDLPDQALSTTPSAVPVAAQDDAPTTVRSTNGPAAPLPVAAPLPGPRKNLRRRQSGPAQELLPTSLSRRSLTAIQDVLSQPPLRRIAAMSALVALLLGGTTVLGAWWVSGRHTETPEQRVAEPVAATTESAVVPGIEDPWELVAELAGARHAYVTGTSEEPVASPGSAARTEDEATRQAYRDYEVRGGGPVIHEAELLEGPGAEGTAVLRVVTSTAEHELEDAQGRSTTVPATEPIEVRLSLRWDGARWLIEAAEEQHGSAGGASD